jgi:hypothetical protein
LAGQIFKAIDKLTKQFGNKGIWIMDRGGDSRKILQKFLNGRKRFIIRLVAEGRYPAKGGKRRRVIR